MVRPLGDYMIPTPAPLRCKRLPVELEGLSVTEANTYRDGSLPRAMLIDMDDTIIALTETSTRCWNDLCVTFAPRLPARDTHELIKTLEVIRNNFWRDPVRSDPYRLNMIGSRRAILAEFLTELGMAEGDEATALAHE